MDSLPVSQKEKRKAGIAARYPEPLLLVGSAEIQVGYLIE